MSTTLQTESFASTNLKERTELSADYVAGTTVLQVASSEGYAAGDIIYVGALSREGCEKATVAPGTDATTLTLVSPLGLPHSRLDAVTSVVGDLIHIYRALNIDGNVPPDGSFSVLATRNIDPDQHATYYTDNSGSANYWYRLTYFNQVNGDETDLTASVPIRGDDFGHYAALGEIRDEAGFANATNLSDVIVDQQRRAAEAEVNASLGNYYTVPFTKPIPKLINAVTVKLAAGFLLQNAYSGQSKEGDTKVKDARDLIKSFQSGTTIIDDDPNLGGVGMSEGVSSWPNNSTFRHSENVCENGDTWIDGDGTGGGRLFEIGDRW